MIDSYTGTFSMYDISTKIFNPPDENKTYDWPAQDFKVTNWNTWMRAFSYWLRDKFDFEISSGPGTSVGLIGHRYGAYGDSSNIVRTAGMDNDWTSDDYGRFYIDNAEWKNTRAESPFRPYEENGTVYYGEKIGNELQWTGRWNGTEIFDDKNNRFDIILTSNSFGKLGLRFKYPLTTTGAKSRNTPVISWKSSTGEVGNNNEYIIKPGIIATLNNEQIFQLTNAAFVDSASGLGNYNYNSSGFIPYYGIVTLLNGRNNLNYINQTWSSNNNFIYYGLNYSSSNECHPWTLDFLTKVSNANSLFINNEINFNKIKFFKSYDNNTLVISIINDNNLIAAQFIFYKNVDNTSGLLIAEDHTWNRKNSRSWYSSDNGKYWINKYVSSDSNNYGNLGNFIATSNNTGNFDNFIVFPTKYFKDVRDNTYGNLIDSTGQWRLENFCGIPTSNTISKNLFLVTKCGTDTLIGTNKFLIGKINNKITKFLVFPFNGASEMETDTSYLMALPVEQEE